MTAVVYFQYAGVVHRGAAVIVADRHRRQRAQAVQLRHCRGRRLNAAHLSGNGKTQLREQFKFQCRDPVGGGENVALQVLQLLGDIALTVYEGLLADIGVRHLIFKGIGHLDVVAENLVVADFQGADAGFLLLLRLHGGHETLAAVENAPESVHFRVKAVPDELPLADGKGRLILQGVGDAPGQIVQRV